MPCKLCIPPEWPHPVEIQLYYEFPRKEQNLAKKKSSSTTRITLSARIINRWLNFISHSLALWLRFVFLCLSSPFGHLIIFVPTSAGRHCLNIMCARQKTLLLLLTTVKLLQEFHYSPRRTLATLIFYFFVLPSCPLRSLVTLSSAYECKSQQW